MSIPALLTPYDVRRTLNIDENRMKGITGLAGLKLPGGDRRFFSSWIKELVEFLEGRATTPAIVRVFSTSRKAKDLQATLWKQFHAGVRAAAGEKGYLLTRELVYIFNIHAGTPHTWVTKRKLLPISSSGSYAFSPDAVLAVCEPI